MADIKTREDRSLNMSAIKSKDTSLEVMLRSMLFRNGFRFRKNYKKLPGHPDIWLKKYNAVIFVNGCFWHRHHNCKYAYNPKSRIDFWEKKFSDNIARDLLIKKQYEELGIKELVVWECSVKKDKKNDYSTILKIIKESLLNDEMYIEI